MTELAYRDENEIRGIVEKFERCDFALTEFTHMRHLTVACWYLLTLPPAEALNRMRDGLRKFISHHGRQGYHETITRFWMELLAIYLRLCPEDAIVRKVNGALQRFASKDVLYDYYSRQLVTSEAAKAAWMEPDLRPFRDSAGASTLEFHRMLEILAE